MIYSTQLFFFSSVPNIHSHASKQLPILTRNTIVLLKFSKADDIQRGLTSNGEMAQPLRVLLALPEDPGLIPSNQLTIGGAIPGWYT